MQRVGRFGAALVGVAGLVVLAGWYAGVTSLTAVVPDYGVMKPNTALAFVALAIAVLVLDRSRLASALGLAVVALGCATLLEAALGRSFGIDVLLPGAGLNRAAARMAPATATALVLLGAGVVACRLGRALAMRCLAMAALVVAEVAVLGYAYGASALYTVGGGTRMALETAACVAVLAIALLLFDPTAGLVGLIRDTGSAGRLLRAAVPSLLIGPAVLGWLRLWAQRHGWFGTAVGVAVLVLSMTALGLALIWRVAVTLRALDRERDDAARSMAQVNETLEARVAQRTKQLADRQSFTEALLETTNVGFVTCDADGANWLRNRAERALLGYGATAAQGLEPQVAAQQTDVFDTDGNRIATENYPLLRALRGEDVGVVELHLGPRGGPLREVLSHSSQILGTDGEVLGAVTAITDISAERASARAYDAERRKLVEAQRLGQLGSFDHDFATGVWEFSEEMAVLWGVELHDMDPIVMRSLILEEDRTPAWQSWLDACRLGGRHDYEYRIRRASDGAQRVLRSAVEIELDRDGKPRRGRGTHLDITDITAAERAAQQANTFLNAVLTASPDFTFIIDLAADVVTYGSRDKDILGVSTEQLQSLGQSRISALVHPDDQSRLLAMNAAAADLVDGQVLMLRYRAMHVDGEWRWLNRRITPFRRDASGNVVEVLGVLRDISDIMEAEGRLTHAALHDELTGLPNRSLLIDRLDAALVRSGRDGREIAVLFCDLDGFKRVNDTAGHAAGDLVLVETARRLSASLRPGDTVARVGGDEFVIVVEPWNRTAHAGHAEPAAHSVDEDRDLAIRVAERVGAATAAPILVHGVEYVVSASIGITYASVAPGALPGSVTAEQVLSDADAAMYLAKQRGKDRFEIFEHGLRTDPAERGRVEQLLREALAHFAPGALGGRPKPAGSRATFAAAYQPVFDSRTGELVSFEALARLTDADGIAIPPEVFIATAELTGLIHPLGRVMLNLACGQLKTWRAAVPGLQNVSMAVNVSALQAQYAALSDDVRFALAANDLNPPDLILELTETALLQVAHSTISSLRALHAEGVGIAIDDFGTGYASLRYLATLPVSAVKVDRSFTAGLPHDETSRKIVKAVAALAADMGLICVVEGVETAEQLAALPAGVHVQGFLTGRPQLPADVDLREILTASTGALQPERRSAVRTRVTPDRV